jgi:hypothetical protein
MLSKKDKEKEGGAQTGSRQLQGIALYPSMVAIWV